MIFVPRMIRGIFFVHQGAGTQLMAVAFCVLFRYYRNIYALALAHAMFGLWVASTIPESVIRHMRVGIGYLHYIRR